MTHGGVEQKTPPNYAQRRRHRHRFSNYAYPHDPREYMESETQAHGFIQGITLCRQDWRPVFDDAECQKRLPLL
jgi:hypothetical protein